MFPNFTLQRLWVDNCSQSSADASADMSAASGFFFENQYFWTVGVFIACLRNAYKPLNLWTGPAALSRALSKVQTICL